MAKILVIDDDQTMLWAYAQCLEAGGHEVVTTWTHNGAKDALAREHFDLVMLDIELDDGMVGKDLASRIPLSTACIIITGHDIEAIKADAARNPFATVRMWMSKPVSPSELLSVIEDLPSAVKP